jgi:hypothetical protein
MELPVLQWRSGARDGSIDGADDVAYRDGGRGQWGWGRRGKREAAERVTRKVGEERNSMKKLQPQTTRLCLFPSLAPFLVPQTTLFAQYLMM